MRASLVKMPGQAVSDLFVDLFVGDTGYYTDAETCQIFDDTGKDMLETFWRMRQNFLKEYPVPFNLIAFHYS